MLTWLKGLRLSLSQWATASLLGVAGILLILIRLKDGEIGRLKIENLVTKHAAESKDLERILAEDDAKVDAEEKAYENSKHDSPNS